MENETCCYCDTTLELIEEDDASDGWESVYYCPHCEWVGTYDDMYLIDRVQRDFRWWDICRRHFTRDRNLALSGHPTYAPYEEWRAQNPPPPAKHLLEAEEQKPERACISCGADISHRRPQATTCSAKCRKAASRSLKV